MQKHINHFILNTSIVIELLGYFWKNKLWWLLPIIIMLLILMLLLLFGQTTGLAPFIYPLF